MNKDPKAAPKEVEEDESPPKVSYIYLLWEEETHFTISTTTIKAECTQYPTREVINVEKARMRIEKVIKKRFKCTVFKEKKQREEVEKIFKNISFVFLVHEAQDQNGPQNYKIGQSKDPERYLNMLQAGNPRTLELIPEYVIPVDNASVAKAAAKRRWEGYEYLFEGITAWYTVPPRQNEERLGEFRDAVAGL